MIIRDMNLITAYNLYKLMVKHAHVCVCISVFLWHYGTSQSSEWRLVSG